MAENFGTSETPNRNDCSESYNEYLRRAVEACKAGDRMLGMHLYLAAYEKAVADPSIPDGMALDGLREAWHLACELKERSLAEYVFEKLEPYLTGEEIAACAVQLQSLALDRLEQYGFSREELEEMAAMISQDFAADGSVMKVESITIPSIGILDASAHPVAVIGASEEAAANCEDVSADAACAVQPTAECADALAGNGEDAPTPASQAAGAPAEESAERPKGKPGHVGMGKVPADGFNPYDYYRDYSIGKSYYSATSEGSGAYVFTRDAERAAAGEKARQQGEAQDASNPQSADESTNRSSDAAQAPAAQAASASGASAGAAQSQQVGEGVGRADASKATSGAVERKRASVAAEYRPDDVFCYRHLAGYDEAVSIMRDMGVGLQNDPAFLDFISMLNEKHGLTRAPALDTLLFRSPALEDASRFVEATIGEIGLPVLRMSMEEGFQGVPMLCVTTQGNNRPRMNHAHNRFEAPAILVIENLDAWMMPEMPEATEGVSGFVMANISRGAHEAVNLIRSAVEDPDVFVLATASMTGEPDPFFYDVLEPMTVIDIGLPTEKERIDIWTEIAQDHPSMRMVSRSELMRLSRGLARYDIYMAARDAIEEAYKLGLIQRGYVPVSAHNIFEKLAACQPLDSDEYRALEDEVIKSFQDEIAELEGLVNGEGQDRA